MKRIKRNILWVLFFSLLVISIFVWFLADPFYFKSPQTINCKSAVWMDKNACPRSGYNCINSENNLSDLPIICTKKDPIQFYKEEHQYYQPLM